MSSRNGRILVGLLWHSFRHHNLGSGALALSNLAMLSSAAEEANRGLAVRVFCPQGPHWYPPAGLVFDEILIKRNRDLIPRSSLRLAISECDVVLDIGEGDQFSDIYGAKSFFWFICLRVAVLKLRKPLILSPQTIGPFKNPYARAVATYVVRRCERVFTRDSKSLTALREMGATHVEECTDVAFRLPYRRQFHKPGKEIRLGLNVSGLLYSQHLAGHFSFGLKVDYPLLIQRLIKSLLERSGVSIVFVPHVIGDVLDDDLSICEKLADKFNVQTVPRFASPIDAKSFISGLDVLIGSRLHATIAALSCGIPVIPLAYTRKFGGLFESICYPLVCDLTALDTESVLTYIHNSIDRLPELRAAAEKSSALAKSKLDGYYAYLVELMRKLA